MVNYSDSDPYDDIHEDYWIDTRTDTPKPIRGATAMITTYPSGQLVWGGNLGDGYGSQLTGCTPFLSLSGQYSFYVFSNGVVNDNTVAVGNADGNVKTLAAPVYAGANGTQTTTWSPTGETWKVFNVYEATAFALYYHNGGLSGETFTVHAGDPTPCGVSCVSGGIVHITSSDAANKFPITHEVGHRIGQLAGLSFPGGYAYDGNGECILDVCGNGQSQCSGSPAGWGPGTLEWVSTAANEGFANFYEAVTWNRQDQADCCTRFGDCEGALSSPYHTAWVDGETCRVPDDPESGAVVDWLRLLWDVYTDGAAPDPAFDYILQEWMVNAADWQRDTTYLELDFQAHWLDWLDPNGAGGDLLANWLGASIRNAPYYCESYNCE